MEPNDLIEIIECKTAEILLDQLSYSRGQIWDNSRYLWSTSREWIFRGVSRADYPLRPAAFRDNAFTYFIPGQAELAILKATDQRNYEDSVIVQFCTKTDRLGIPVPGDHPELRDLRSAIQDYDPAEFPPIKKLHMFALAQHYGIPTRLLDWTRKPLVAAYFAAEKVAKVRSKRFAEPDVSGNDPCAIWALDAGFIRTMSEKARTNRSIDPEIILVTAPTVTNPNLAAQGGLFTLVQPRSGDPHPLPDLDSAITQLAKHVPTDVAQFSPFLYKLTLPATETRSLMRLLAIQGVDAAAVRPGLAGVADSLRECWSHQFAPPGQRS